jgi:hypothetical protein
VGMMINKLIILQDILDQINKDISGHEEQIEYGNLDKYDLFVVESRRSDLILRKQVIIDQIKVLSE